MNDQGIQSIREFNRFYTNIIGLVDRNLLNSPYSLPEARVLYELHHHQPCSSSDITAILHIDKGYLSRILAGFRKKKLIARKQSSNDGRSSLLSLTAKGQSEFEKLNQSSIEQIQQLLKNLSADEQKLLLTNMRSIQQILTKRETT